MVVLVGLLNIYQSYQEKDASIMVRISKNHIARKAIFSLALLVCSFAKVSASADTRCPLTANGLGLLGAAAIVGTAQRAIDGKPMLTPAASPVGVTLGEVTTQKGKNAEQVKEERDTVSLYAGPFHVGLSVPADRRSVIKQLAGLSLHLDGFSAQNIAATLAVHFALTKVLSIRK